MTIPEADLDFTVFDLPTRYNGLCKVYEMRQAMKPKAYYNFRILKHQTYLLTITAPGEYIFQIDQQWPYTILDTVEVNSDVIIEFEKYTYHMLPREHNPCKLNENMTHFIQCFKQELWDKFQNHDCISPMFETLFLPYIEQVNPCLDEQIMREQYNFYLNKALNFSKKVFDGSKCEIPCTIDRYTPFVSRSKDTKGKTLKIQFDFEVFIVNDLSTSSTRNSWFQ